MKVNNTEIGHEIILNKINVTKLGNLSPNLTLFTTLFLFFFFFFKLNCTKKKVLSF